MAFRLCVSYEYFGMILK